MQKKDIIFKEILLQIEKNKKLYLEYNSNIKKKKFHKEKRKTWYGTCEAESNIREKWSFEWNVER